MSKKSTLKKVEKELERRLQRIAQGLPVTNTWSDKLVPTRFWKTAKWEGSHRVIRFTCECGKEHRVEVGIHARKIFWRVIGVQKKKHKGVIEKNLQKGDLTKGKLQDMIAEKFYAPTHVDKTTNSRR